MKQIPFKMIVETEMEKYRHDTWDSKEPETIAWIDSFTDGDVFFDVGANIGIYSLYCAAIHPKCQIYAFEPDGKNYNRLLKNIARNGFKISGYPRGISDRNAIVRFYEASRMAGASGGQVDEIVQGCPISYDVQINTIDSLSAVFGIPANIKIDIDGQELKVIQGMRETLKDERLKSVLVEAHPQDKAEIMGIMDRAGFIPDYRFNCMTPHSRERRATEGIPEENIIFSRKRGLND